MPGSRHFNLRIQAFVVMLSSMVLGQEYPVLCICENRSVVSGTQCS